MGLASKLRANQNAAAPGGVPPPAGVSFGQPPQAGGFVGAGAPPPAGGFMGGNPPGAQGYMPQGSMGVQPPQTQYGGYGGPGGPVGVAPNMAGPAYEYQQSNMPAPTMTSGAQALNNLGGKSGMSSSGSPGGIYGVLRKCVQERSLSRFYQDGQLQQLASSLESKRVQVDALARKWKMNPEVAVDLYQLALWDVIMLCDDSGSMAFEDHGERIEDLKMTIGYVAEATALFDSDGICVRFLNSNLEGNGITDYNQAIQLCTQVRFNGLTPLGTTLENKILQPFYYGPMRNNTMMKPLLIIVLTDGSPAGETHDKVMQVLSQVKHTTNGQGLALSFAQIGNDQQAQKFLMEIDTHKDFGELVDCTSSYELESAELQRKGLTLEPEMWVAKLLLGGIDSTYDKMDDKVRQQ